MRNAGLAVVFVTAFCACTTTRAVPDSTSHAIQWSGVTYVIDQAAVLSDAREREACVIDAQQMLASPEQVQNAVRDASLDLDAFLSQSVRKGRAIALPFIIQDDALRFEHQGSLYVVTDTATVESARRTGNDLAAAGRALNHQWTTGISSREYYDREYAGTTAIRGIEPAQPAPTASERESSAATQQLMNNSMGFSDELSEGMTQQRRLEDDLARATKRLKKIFERAVQSGVAQKAG
jgi:hypothetical protein